MLRIPSPRRRARAYYSAMEGHDGAAGGAERRAVLDLVEEAAGAMCRSEQRVCWALARGIESDMEPAAYSVLSAVRLAGSCRVTDLSATLGMSRSAVSGHVAALQRLGLVERGTTSGDERSQPVALTEEGRRRVDHARGARRSYFRRQLEGWNQADVLDLAELLSRFNASYLGAEVADGAAPPVPGNVRRP
ncbi:winged helix-turn-helix transcriptional regulator [Arthrobacter sp. NamB2]|nr:winged helix-turn-helix transcriptional regulator [Arthrobacter sp. NamB2]